MPPDFNGLIIPRLYKTHLTEFWGILLTNSTNWFFQMNFRISYFPGNKFTYKFWGGLHLLCNEHNREYYEAHSYQQWFETLSCMNSILATLWSTCGAALSLSAQLRRWHILTNYQCFHSSRHFFKCSLVKYVFSSYRTYIVLLGLISTYFIIFVVVTSIERILPYHVPLKKF